MAASRIDGIGVDLTYKGFEVDAKSPRSSWSLGCDITITDADTSIREIKVNDVALSGEIRTDDISVNLNKDKNNVMDLDVSVAVNGIGHSVPESHIVPYVDILKITELSPETINEKRYASSALSVKNIYDLIVTLNKKVEELAHNGEDGSNDNETPQNGWYFKDDMLCTDYNVAVFGSLGVGGVANDGGDNGTSGGIGTVTSIVVNGAYYNPDSNGVINLTDALTLNLSNYYTKQEISANYATKSALNLLQEDVDKLEETIKGLLSMWYFKDEILCTDNNVAIFGQLGVGEVGQGDTGGSGGVGTVNAVSVSGVIYSPTDGIIDLTEPFANIDVDLSDYYKRNEVNTKLSDLILNISQTYVTKDAIAGMQNSIASLDKRILVFEEWFKDDGENNIKTTYNFYSTKQIAAGGAAESGDGGSAGGGTVNAVSVNNIVYSPTDGIIDLSEAFANVEVDLSGYYTKSQVDTKISAIDFTPYLTKSIASETYATKESLASTKSSILDSVEATYATKEVVSSISTRVTELGDEVSTLKKDVSALSQRVAVFENWFKDDGEGNIKTTYNFYSTKQLAAGGVGEEGEANGGGSVNAVSVNNVVYSPTDGIIDLTKAFDAIDVSDQLANYATKSALSTLEGRVDTIASYFSTSEDADSQINKWNEIVAFLDATEGTTLDSILSGFLPLSGGTISGALNVTGTVTADKFYMPKPAGGSYDRFRLRDDGSSSIVFQAAKWDGTGTSGSMAFSGLYGDALTSFSIVSNSTAITGSVSIGGSTSITGSNSVGGSLSVTGSTKLSSYLFLGSNAEGIYLDGTTLSWHDATNTYVNSLLRFAQDSVSVSRAMYLDKTLSLVERLYANGGAYIKGKVNFGADADGILIQDNYIAWHTSSNTEANRLIDFAATSIAITPAVTLNSTLGVTGAATLSSTLAVTGASTFTGNTTNKGIAYFAGGTTYYVNASGAAKFASLTSAGAISGTNGSFSGTLAVTGASTFTGKTTHNGGIGATTGAFSSTLSVSGATTLKSTLGVTGAATLSSTLSVAGLLTASAGIKIGSIMLSDESGTLKIAGNAYTTGQLAAGEAGEEGGGGSGGVMLLTSWTNRPSDLSGYALGATLGVDLNNRVTTLEGKATAVSFSQTLTSGKQIGTITIDGTSKALYAPSTYAWGDVTGKPSFASVATSGKYGDLSGVPTSLPASDVYAWAKASTKPSYKTSEVTEETNLYFTSARAVSAVLGSSAIGSTSAYPYWTGSAWKTQALPTKLSQFTNDRGFISGIDAAAVTSALGYTPSRKEGSESITTLGTITTGTWEGTAIANAYLANSAITINGSSTSLGGSFSTASITAGTAGTSSATSGYTLSVPYVTMNKYGIVTGYGTHTHTINSIPNSSLTNSAITIAGTSVSLGSSITAKTIGAALTSSAPAAYATSAGNADTVDGYHHGSFAKVATYNNLMHTSDEFTFVSAAYSGVVHINYRTASGSTDGNITKYLFCNGAGAALATITNGAFSGNAASATKLQTARTIWGQSFDGTGNVSGALSGATTGAFSSNVTVGGILGVTGATALSSTLAVTGASTFTGNTTNKGIAYFANGTTYYVNASGAAKFASLTSAGAISGTNGSFSGTLAVTGASTFTGKTTHNGGIGATSGTFSSTFSVTGATTLKSTLGVSGATTLSSTLSVSGLLTASSGIKIAAGQSITFLDSSGNSHTLSYDSTNEAFKFAGSMYATGQLAAGSVGTVEGTNAGGGNDVSFSQTLTSGTQIGVITIDGTSKTLYAPSAVSVVQTLTSGTKIGTVGGTALYAPTPTTSLAWSAITGKPTTVSGYGITDAVTLTGSQALTNKTYNGYTLGAACAYSVTTSVTSGSSALVTSGAVYAAIQGLSSGGGDMYGAEIPIAQINGKAATVPNNSVILVSSAVSLNFKNVTPEDASRPGIVYLVKTASVAVTVPVYSTSGIALINASGTMATAGVSVTVYNGLTLIWVPSVARWIGYIYNA